MECSEFCLRQERVLNVCILPIFVNNNCNTVGLLCFVPKTGELWRANSSKRRLHIQIEQVHLYATYHEGDEVALRVKIAR